MVEYKSTYCKHGYDCKSKLCPFSHSRAKQEEAQRELRNIKCPFSPCKEKNRRCPYYHDRSKSYSPVNQTQENRVVKSPASAGSPSHSSIDSKENNSRGMKRSLSSRSRSSMDDDYWNSRDAKRRMSTHSRLRIENEGRNRQTQGLKTGSGLSKKLDNIKKKIEARTVTGPKFTDPEGFHNKHLLIREFIEWINVFGKPLPKCCGINHITGGTIGTFYDRNPGFKESIKHVGGVQKLLYFSPRLKFITEKSSKKSYYVALNNGIPLDAWKAIEGAYVEVINAEKNNNKDEGEIITGTFLEKSAPQFPKEKMLASAFSPASCRIDASKPKTEKIINPNVFHKRDISEEELSLRKGIVILDLDNALLHFMKKKDFPEGAAQISEEIIEVGEDYKLALRCGAKTLVKSVKKLGLSVHIVTQNLEGEKIVAALAESDKKVWYGIPVHVVKDREPRSKRLGDIIKTKNHIPIDKIRSWTIILDDQEKCWAEEDVTQVIRLRKYDITNPISGKKKLLQEKQHLTSILLQVLEFSAERVNEERNEFYNVVKQKQ